MQSIFFCLLLLSSAYFATGQSLRETPQQALNQYVAFLNQSTDDVAARFQQIQAYYADIKSYQSQTRFPARLSSSGTLEEYYYKKAIASEALTDAEKERLKASAQSLWNLVNKIDQTVKALETYNRLKDYQRDNFKKATALITDIQALTTQFSRNKDAFYKQIQRVYRRYQPYRPTDAYLYTEKEMDLVLVSQQQLLDTLGYYLNENGPSNWPVDLVQKSILADEKLLSGFGKAKSTIDYPASDMLSSFQTGLQAIQAIKKRAVDDYTFAARQSARHGNEFYASFINQYNNDLISWYQNFVRQSTSIRQLLDYPKFSLVFAFDMPTAPTQKSTRTEPFRDVQPIAFTTKPATTSASEATFLALNAYVEFINESLRQMNRLQLLVRDYQSSADYFREPNASKRRAGLTYSHDEFKVPISEHQSLIINSQQIPQPYRVPINTQADVLLAILKEMDALSIELITYTSEKQYEQDHMQRSDAILDRYAYLFDAFDQKKEQLYRDVRRVHESYPVKKPVSSWIVSGNALQNILDTDKEVLFGIRAYLKGEINQVPTTDSLQAKARTLISNEYQNLKGLKRFGRNNGLCPYSPYEDLAESSLKLAEMTQRISARESTHPYESLYYFFNNELVYEYNKFSELAKVGVLKAINEPNIFAFRRSSQQTSLLPATETARKPAVSPVADRKSVEPIKSTENAPASTAKTRIQHDTVYVNQTKVDTVFIDRSGPPNVVNSLTGFAANNMVLLLDVSGSMDSPYKLPLLKKSIKSLLNIIRPKDQLSVIVYSGKPKVALKPTSGTNAEEIARVIDQLQSNGDTNGNGGIRLAYKVANKNYIRAGNNRIILATDGEFPVSDEVYELVSEASSQDVYLTIFTFGRNEVNGQNLKKLAQIGKGSYTHITQTNANLQLILEAQAKKAP